MNRMHFLLYKCFQFESTVQFESIVRFESIVDLISLISNRNNRPQDLLLTIHDINSQKI